MKRKQNKGFILAELLIVVAIIAVLVAISIPIFNNQLRKARLAANKANARAALSAAMAEFIDAPEADKARTPHGNSYHMYFRYDTATGRCEYRCVWSTSPGKDDKEYKSFANIGYHPNNNGLGESDVSKWNENITYQVVGAKDTGTILTDRTYRYWDIAMQGDGTFLAIVCLW